LHNLLLLNRRQAVQENLVPDNEKRAVAGFRFTMLHRWVLDLPFSSIKSWVVGRLFADTWGKRRENLAFPKKNFKSLWKDYQKQGPTGRSL
jgi:L-lactate dehydrogenase complex protein LldF